MHIKNSKAKRSKTDGLQLLRKRGIHPNQRIRQSPTEPRLQKSKSATNHQFGNRFLSVTLDPIPYLHLKADKFQDELKGLVELKKSIGWLGEGLNETDPAKLASEMAKLFTGIAKEAEFNWCIAEADDKPVLLFHYEFKAYGSWLAPMLSFLPKLKHRSARMHETVLSSMQHMAQEFRIEGFIGLIPAVDWAIEELDSDACDMEDAEERGRIYKSIESHSDGKASKALKEIRNAPSLDRVQCIERLFKMPEDLRPLTKALIQLLCLADRGRDLSDFDFNYAGFNNLDQLDDFVYLTLEYQQAWIYDENPLTAKAEEYLDSLSHEGVQEPATWLAIGEAFSLPKDRESLIKKLVQLKADDFTDKFYDAMADLCEAIVQIYHTKK